MLRPSPSHTVPLNSGNRCIFVLSKTDEYHRQQARQLGANLWLQKPVSFSDLLWAISLQLNNPIEKYGLS